MGTWSIWHFAIFIIAAVLGATMARTAGNHRKTAAGLNGYGGWLLVLSIFLVYWAAQELGEFYRVKAQLETLIPSAMGEPQYETYISLALGLAWFEALVLLACSALLIKSRVAWASKATIAGLWLAGPLAAGTELILAESYFGEYIVEHDYSALAATILFATTWTCYLLVSARVRQTYRAKH